jgi:hypothetical protein
MNGISREATVLMTLLVISACNMGDIRRESDLEALVASETGERVLYVSTPAEGTAAQGPTLHTVDVGLGDRRDVLMLEEDEVVGVASYHERTARILLLTYRSDATRVRAIHERTGEETPVARFEGTFFDENLALSPNGERYFLAYSQRDPGGKTLGILEIRSAENHEIIAQASRSFVFEEMWAPDNSGVYFSTETGETEFLAVKAKPAPATLQIQPQEPAGETRAPGHPQQPGQWPQCWGASSPTTDVCTPTGGIHGLFNDGDAACRFPPYQSTRFSDHRAHSLPRCIAG